MPNPEPLACDVVIRGGTVIDGSGGPRVRADVFIDGNRIVAVGLFDDVESKQQIDASNRVVAPGFIDTHTHDDRIRDGERQSSQDGEAVTGELPGQLVRR